MDFPLTRSPKSYFIHSDSSSQTRRPSVKWDLNSDYEDVGKETTGHGTDFRRERLDSLQSDYGIRVQPQTRFLRPRTPSIYIASRLSANDANVKKLLPKSHLSRVIIRDNLNAQRIYEMEMHSSDKTKRKMSGLYEHLKKKFMSDQLRKMLRWRRESLSTQQYLDSQRTSRGST